MYRWWPEHLVHGYILSNWPQQLVFKTSWVCPCHPSGWPPFLDIWWSPLELETSIYFIRKLRTDFALTDTMVLHKLCGHPVHIPCHSHAGLERKAASWCGKVWEVVTRRKKNINTINIHSPHALKENDAGGKMSLLYRVKSSLLSRTFLIRKNKRLNYRF